MSRESRVASQESRFVRQTEYLILSAAKDLLQVVRDYTTFSTISVTSLPENPRRAR
jgi:hypothetical protein